MMTGAPDSDPVLRDLVRLVLRLVVAREPVTRYAFVGLVNDFAARVAEVVHGRYVDDLGYVRIDRRVQGPLRPGDVGLVHLRTLFLGNTDLVHGGDMEDRVAALHRVAQRVLVGEVSLGDVAPGLLERTCLGPGADERDHVIAPFTQFANDVTTDESRAARYKRLHARSLVE